MAHFAQIDETNSVIQVVVVNNEVIQDSKGKESESLGITFLKSLYGEETNWVQTSYNGSFRGRFAGLGDKYDSALDAFTVGEMPNE